MKKFEFLLLIMPVALSFNLYAQGVMPTPTTCREVQRFDILSAPLMRPFEINFDSLICNDSNLFGDAFDPTINYVHNKIRCDEVNLCSSKLKDKDLKEAENIIQDNIFRAVYVGVLTKEIAANRDYNIALNSYEEKNKVKVCDDEPIDFDCDHKLRQTLVTVVDSLIDYPEFDRAPASGDDLQSFVPKKFFSRKDSKVPERKLEDLKKDCSKKLSLKNVCELSKARLEKVNKCDKSSVGINCFEDEQRAWASITNDFKSNNRDIFLAIERQLCQSNRLSKAAGQAMPSFSPMLPHRRQRVSLDSGAIRTQQIVTMAQLNAEEREKPASNNRSNSPSDSDVKKQESFTIGDGIKKAASDSDVVHGATDRDSVSLSDSFSNSVDQMIGEKSNSGTSNTIANTAPPVWNNDFMNRAHELTEEQKAAAEAEAQKKKSDEAADTTAASDKKKKQEVDALVTQISSLKTKLDEMNSKVEDLKTKKASGAVEESEKAAQERENSILELKKKIAELEADKRRKEAEAKSAKEDENARLARANEERNRSNYAVAATSGSYKNTQNSNDQGAEAASERAREKAASGINNNSSSSEGGRSPASIGSAGGAQTASISQIVLKSVGSQATPDSNVVYMTQNELQRYPYRLSDKASAVEIEKMLEGTKGSTIILGDSEQIVPILENGAVQLDENGKIKFKRIKISLVKNDKEKKQQIAREISSVADLKKEEQRRRDLIRYQQMKKELQLK
jgi:hypothetical protein